MNSARPKQRTLIACLSGAVVASATVCSTQALATSSATLRAASHVAPLRAVSAGTIRSVTTCTDSVAGSLRAQITASSAGDTIDLSGLPAADPGCVNSTITLTGGAISIAHNLTLLGPKDATLTIAQATFLQRVFVDTSTDAPTPYLQISYLTLRDGVTTGSGGCINAAGVEVRLDHALVTNCIVGTAAPAGHGGAINALSVVLTNGSAVTNNKANKCTSFCSGNSRGGGIYATSFSCTDSTVSGNYAVAGGGAFIRGATSIARCTIDSNSTQPTGGPPGSYYGQGGGLLLRSIGTPTITISQSTIANNTAANGTFYGGAAWVRSDFSSATISNSTVSDNSSGVVIGTGFGAAIESSIMARNGTNDLNVLYSLNPPTGTHNLINSLNFTPPDGFNSVSGDPKFWPLANHGGPTRTLALQGTSPAINNGSNGATAGTDQRGSGFAREVPTGLPDIGAFELQALDDEIFWNDF